MTWIFRKKVISIYNNEGQEVDLNTLLKNISCLMILWKDTSKILWYITFVETDLAKNPLIWRARKSLYQRYTWYH